MPWLAVAVIAVALPMLFIIAAFILIAVRGPHLKVDQADWNRNLLDFSHPEHFFYLGAFVLLASGVVACIRSQFVLGHVLPSTAAPVALAAGVWVGLRALAYISSKESLNVT